jgi:hypothetical protein
MAFLKQNTAKTVVYFGPLTQQNGPFKNRDWAYWTTDSAAAVGVDGYLDDADVIASVRVGDVIRVYTVSSLTADPLVITDVSELLVLSNDGTTVELSSDLWGGSVVTSTS